MKFFAFVFAAVFAAFSMAAPQRVIFDTDMGNDVDDALALAMLYDYQKSGQADLAAVLLNKDNPYAPVFVSVMNCYYGFDSVPIGMVRNGKTKEEGRYIGAVLKSANADGSYKYPRKIDSDSKLVEAHKLARKVLAESADGSVVYISVGFSTNVSRLIDSQPDEISPLSGRELVAKKVKYFSVMAGQFGLNARAKRYNPEYNVKTDLEAARNFMENSPVPIVFSGFEVGEILNYPKEAVEEKLSNDNPLAVSYKLYARSRNGNLFNACTFDLTSVLYVFSPELFDLSENGTVSIAKSALTDFKPSPDGKHRYLKIPQGGGQKIVAEMVRRSTTIKPKAE